MRSLLISVENLLQMLICFAQRDVHVLYERIRSMYRTAESMVSLYPTTWKPAFIHTYMFYPVENETQCKTLDDGARTTGRDGNALRYIVHSFAMTRKRRRGATSTRHKSGWVFNLSYVKCLVRTYGRVSIVPFAGPRCPTSFPVQCGYVWVSARNRGTTVKKVIRTA